MNFLPLTHLCFGTSTWVNNCLLAQEGNGGVCVRTHAAVDKGASID